MAHAMGHKKVPCGAQFCWVYGAPISLSVRTWTSMATTINPPLKGAGCFKSMFLGGCYARMQWENRYASTSVLQYSNVLEELMVYLKKNTLITAQKNTCNTFNKTIELQRTKGTYITCETEYISKIQNWGELFAKQQNTLSNWRICTLGEASF